MDRQTKLVVRFWLNFISFEISEAYLKWHPISIITWRIDIKTEWIKGCWCLMLIGITTNYSTNARRTDGQIVMWNQIMVFLTQVWVLVCFCLYKNVWNILSKNAQLPVWQLLWSFHICLILHKSVIKV